MFAPIIAIQIADFFLLKHDHSAQTVDVRDMAIWAIGFIVYPLLMNVDMPVGNTLLDMAITVVICILGDKLMINK